MALKLELDQDQKDGLDFLLKSPYSILGMDMGLGKTSTILGVYDRLKDARLLVVCPAYLMFNWVAEIDKFMTNQKVSVFDSSKKFYFPFDSDIVIVSYDLAIKYPRIFEWATLVAFDEATALKNMNAKRTEAVHKLIFENSVKRMHLMTGTPIENRIEEFYSLIALCNYNPRIEKSAFLEKFPSKESFADYFSYRKEFEKYIGNKRIKIVSWRGIRKKRLPELKEWLKDIYFRRKSKLPPITYVDVVLEDFNDSALLDAFETYDFDSDGSVMPDKKAEAALRTVPLTIKHVESLREQGLIEGPIIVWSDHRESTKALAAHFKTVPVTGEMVPTKRQEIADAFQRGEIETLCTTYGAMNKGYTLTRSNFAIDNDIPWVPGVMLQADRRINRKGQTRPCTVCRIFASAQSYKIFEIVKEKADTISQVY